MTKGELAIIVNDFIIYHPNCYRKEREEAFNGLGITYNEWLDDTALRIDDFALTASIDSIKDMQVFYNSWVKQLMVPQILKFIVWYAQRMGVIGPIHEYQLNRKINNVFRMIVGIAEEYRDGFGAIRIVDSMKSISNESKLLLHEVKGISKKLTEAERKKLRKQIENIDKETRPLP